MTDVTWGAGYWPLCHIAQFHSWCKHISRLLMSVETSSVGWVLKASLAFWWVNGTQWQEICVASRDGQCPELMLSGPEDHILLSHPLYYPDQVSFLLKLTPGRDHSQLEWFQTRNAQCVFWYSPFLCAGGCFLFFQLSAEGCTWQNKCGGISVFRIHLDSSVPTNEKNSRKLCENNPYVYVVRALRE